MHGNQPATPTTTLMTTNSVPTMPLQLRMSPITPHPITVHLRVPRRYNLFLSVAIPLVVEAMMKRHMVPVPACPYPARPRIIRHRHLSLHPSTRIQDTSPSRSRVPLKGLAHKTHCLSATRTHPQYTKPVHLASKVLGENIRILTFLIYHIFCSQFFVTPWSSQLGQFDCSHVRCIHVYFNYYV